jgi:23S rRNA (guanosine2251-2'-O)-methyltransferase
VGKLFGFHAVGVRLKTAPKSILEVGVFDATAATRACASSSQRAQEAGVRLVEADGLRLSKLCGSHGHQGVVARVEPWRRSFARRPARRARRGRHRPCCWCWTA